jgi:hypothetical protein
MTETKHGKQVIREPFRKTTEDFGGASVLAYTNEDKAGAVFEYHCINQAGWSIKDSRIHDTWELLGFIGGNPENINDLGAEVSVCLGDEKEEHIITSAAIVSMPPGLKHCPLIVRNVTRPLVFLEVSMTKDFAAERPEGG